MSFATIIDLPHDPSGNISAHTSTNGKRPMRLQVLLVIAALLTAATFPGPQSWFETSTRTTSVSAPLAAASTPSSGTISPESLSPEMRVALDYAARRYRVSADALEPIFVAAQRSAEEAKLDPLLVVAVIAIESRFNPFAESVVGAQGLMQVIPRFHAEKFPENAGKLPLFDPVINVQVGTRALSEYIQRYGSTVAGLQQYAGAFDDPEQVYANKVQLERERFEGAFRRRNVNS